MSGVELPLTEKAPAESSFTVAAFRNSGLVNEAFDGLRSAPEDEVNEK